MAKIGATNVYYVRCIKPNSLKSPTDFEHSSVINQLRCAGVVEAIRVSRSAYPNSMVHAEALMSFAMLAPGGMRWVVASRPKKSPSVLPSPISFVLSSPSRPLYPLAHLSVHLQGARGGSPSCRSKSSFAAADGDSVTR